MGTTHQGTLPSPLPYVMKVLDKRAEKRCEYSFEMLYKLVLMAISAKSENILTISQWLNDHRDDLFGLGVQESQK